MATIKDSSSKGVDLLARIPIPKKEAPKAYFPAYFMAPNKEHPQTNPALFFTYSPNVSEDGRRYTNNSAGAITPVQFEEMKKAAGFEGVGNADLPTLKDGKGEPWAYVLPVKADLRVKTVKGYDKDGKQIDAKGLDVLYRSDADYFFPVDSLETAAGEVSREKITPEVIVSSWDHMQESAKKLRDKEAEAKETAKAEPTKKAKAKKSARSLAKAQVETPAVEAEASLDEPSF